MKIRIILITIGLWSIFPLYAKANTGNELIQVSNEFVADYGSLSRFYQIEGSSERLERFIEFYENYSKRLNEYDFKELSKAEQIDYLLIKNEIDNSIYELNVEKQENAKLKEWFGYSEQIYTLEKLRRRGKKQNWKQVASELDNMKENILELTEQLSSTNKFPNNLIKRAKNKIKGQRYALKSVYQFYKGYDPDFSWWIEKPYLALDETLENYSKVFSSRVDDNTQPKDDGSGIIGNPIGRNEVIRQLQSSFINYSPEELIEIAMKEFSWCDKELLKVSKEMGFGDDWKAAQEQVKQSYVEVGKQPETMLELYDQSINFLTENELITIPPLAEETWRMEMLSPERQLIAPFFLGGEVLQIAYPTNDMEHGDKLMSLRGNNPHFARAVVHHELIAGHHLQFFMSERFNSHRFNSTPFWVEGWALYWELILWDLGFPRSPEDKIGMLFWRMHRCARIIFSLNYHLGNWTPQQCIDYLVERVGHERTTAEGEVRRSFTGNYGPLYQIAYMTGGLQFYELKRELVDSGKMTYKEFHDKAIKENIMPVELIRAILLDKKLNKNYKTNWEFYNK